MGKYYLGLDMGTSTVGWAVTDEEYRLIRKKGKDLWGVREFEEAKTSAERRTFRVSRRRRQREQVRIGLLKNYFADAIEAVDPNFYARLENSKYHLEDKDDSVKTSNALFADKDYSDKEYFEKYPTIFHLRKELIHSKEPHDVREVFLALLNMYKHRGHFLNAGTSSEGNMNMTEAYYNFTELLDKELELCFPQVDASEIELILSKRDYSKSAKAEKLAELFGISKKQKREMAFVKTICGLKGDAKVLFGLEELTEKIDIEFSSFGYDEKEPSIHAAIGDDLFDIVTAMKQVYDIGSLSGILRGFDYLSEARIEDYEKHGKDLKILKKLMKEYGTEEQYNKMFRSEENGSYSAYVNSVSHDKLYSEDENSKHRRNMKGRKRDDFYATTKKIVDKMPKSDERVTYVLHEIEIERFMPKQLSPSNGVIPYQVHEKEMKAILKNAKEYLPFLNDVDESGLSVADRILKIFTFQVPYYVGPVSENSKKNGGNGWVVRKEKGQVLPWNIKDKIDMKKTSEQFISNMVRMCTYINGERVLPKTSLLYESYCVLNEINNLKIDNEKITVELKQDIYNTLFKKGKKVTKKKLAKYLESRGLIIEESQISGIDININSSLTSYGKFQTIFGEEIDTDYGKKRTEDIIFWCTVYGDSKELLIENIKEHYPEITEAQLKRITGMKFKDWGRLSKEFLLLQGCNKETGEIMSIKQALWETNCNLMELLSDRFTYASELKEKEDKAFSSLKDAMIDMLDEYYFSAPVKKMIWQTLGIIKEVEKLMGEAPDRVFIEMTRHDDEKGDKGRKASRKSQLLDLYKNIKDESKNWKEIIESADETGKLRSKKMYLYLTQMGRDMYTGNVIDLDDLFNDNLYDIDHIYPRHFVKDDSIHNNLVLVKKEQNAHKSDTYPLEASIRNSEKVRNHWHLLKEKGLINEEKYRRLMGNRPFSEEQKADFIARQLVETSQATKGVADILKKVLPESQIVYAKASNVSDFRHKYNLLKSRLINDFHHANDAYLNIVVGNVYYTKFTNNPRNFIRSEYMRDSKKYNYHLSQMFNWDVKREEKIAWIASKKGELGTIETVKKMIEKNTPIITRYSFINHGGIADQTLYGHRKAKADNYIPLKANDEKMEDVTRYGGFSSVSTAYFFLVEHDVKKKRIRTLETVPVYLYEKIESNPEELEKYCDQVLGLKNYSIRLRKIKIQSLMKLNGFFVNISGKTGKRIILRNAVNMCLNKTWMNYIKKLEKYADSNVIDDTISIEKNIELYDELTQKHLEQIFKKRPNPVGDKLKDGRDKYIKLSKESQIEVLIEILKLSSIGPTMADLSKIGGAGKSGVMLCSKEVTKAKECIIINQTALGIVTNHVDLLTV